MARPFRLDRRWQFAVTPAQLWAVLSRTEDYPRWWTWLRRFEADGLVEGTTARCTVRAPVPWTLHFDVDVRRVVPGRLIEGHATGAIEGPARLEISDDDGHAVARLVWEVQLRDPVLRAAARMGRPLLEWGQRWVVDTGVDQFRRRALSTPPTTAP